MKISLPSGDPCECYGVGCDSVTGSDEGTNQNEPEDEEDLKKCDAGFVKNANNDCVPCPDGNCNDCGNNQFRDICGSCTDEIISEPKVVEGRCNGI